MRDPMPMGGPQPAHGPRGNGLACPPVQAPVPGFWPDAPTVKQVGVGVLLAVVGVAVVCGGIVLCAGTAGVGCAVLAGAGAAGGVAAAA